MRLGKIIRKNLLFLPIYLVLFFLLFITATNQVKAEEAIIPNQYLDVFSNQNIFYYNPCANGTLNLQTNSSDYKNAQYSFSDEELKRFWWAALAEQGESGAKTELSIFANVYEADGGEPGNNQGLIDKIVERYKSGNKHGWFASTTGEAFETGAVASWGVTYPEPTSEQIAIAKDILNNGNRTIPKEIDEHDSINDITSVSNNGSEFDKTDKSQYKTGTTIIKNRMGSTYTFFQWANGDKECSGDSNSCGDPFGYKGQAPAASYLAATTVGNNTLYDGRQVLSDAQLQQIENNKRAYQEAAEAYNMPWQILAALHYREHSLKLDNPGNGQGIYQLYSYTNGGKINTFTPGPVDEAEFIRQTKLAAEFVRNSAGDDDLTDENNVKKVFFKYNGTASLYKEKARCLGFSEEQANIGEGSPYVMNMADAMRDPANAAMSQCWPGAYRGDHNYVADATEDRPGAFVIYQALGGSTGGGLSTGGLCQMSYSGLAHNNDIAQAAIELSWEGRNSHSKSDPKPQYIAAMKEAGTYASWGGAPIGASCDQFVATVMRYTGADKNFNLYTANGSGAYMASRPELYSEIKYDGSNPEILQPGDIFSTVGSGSGGHIWIYVEIDGQYGRADASYNDRTAEHYITANPETRKNGSMPYRVFRRNKGAVEL